MSVYTEYKKAVELLRDRHNREAEALAADIRREIVLPLCKLKRLEFRAGMGTWTIWNPRSKVYVYHQEVPNIKRVTSLLSMHMNDSYPHEVGERMENVKGFGICT